MKHQIKFISFLPFVIRMIFLLVAGFALSSCAMISGESNYVSESEVSSDKKMYSDLLANEDEAKVVIVHRYTKKCCGANPSVEIRGEQTPKGSWSNDLVPLEDFVCWRAKPGVVRLTGMLADKAVAKHQVNLDDGETAFIAVDSDLRKTSYDLSFQVVSKSIGLHHLHKTLDRVRHIASEGYYKEDPSGPLAIRAAQFVKNKLQCVPAADM